MLKNRSVFALITLTTALVLGTALTACTKKEGTETAATDSQSSAATGTSKENKPAATQAKLEMNDIKVGDGAAAETGKKVFVHYTGWLSDGKKFDSSIDRGQPLPFQLGAGQVIKGWDQGIVGMKVGGKRKLTIPPQLAYGEAGAGAIIPPNSTLVFEVELTKVE